MSKKSVPSILRTSLKVEICYEIVLELIDFFSFLLQMPMNRWQVLSIHSFSIEMSGYHFFQISEYLDTHNVWILGYKCIFGGSKRKRSCFGKSPYVLFRKAPNVQLSELKLCDCDFPASLSNNSLRSCKHIFSNKVSLLGVDSVWVIARLFQQIGGHGSRFVLFCSF